MSDEQRLECLEFQIGNFRFEIQDIPAAARVFLGGRFI
jgi:hypothetical protein